MTEVNMQPKLTQHVTNVQKSNIVPVNNKLLNMMIKDGDDKSRKYNKYKVVPKHLQAYNKINQNRINQNISN